MTSDQIEMLAWIGRIGAAAAQDVAAHSGVSPAAVRARLAAAERAGLLRAHRLLHGQPALYALTRAGLRECGLAGRLDPCRVSAAGFNHARAVARVAVALERALPGAVVIGERELRALERDAGRALASAELGFAAHGGEALHRPDLVLWPDRVGGAVAIEVELTVKAAARLRRIVRGWARSRRVAGVVYYASEPAARALAVAVTAEQAGASVHVLGLARAGELPAGLRASTSAIPRPA